MTAIAERRTTEWTVADIMDRFGPMPFGRIRQDPPPGTATVQDVVDIHDREKRLYELVDGVLVEKTNGTHESTWTVADLLEHFGPIPLRRIRQDPRPGTATEQDVFDIHDHEDRLYELVDGVLVEKTMGKQESFLAALIVTFLGGFVNPRQLGFVLGADGMAQLAPGLIRIPDVSFVSWRQVPSRRISRTVALEFAPDLAVEVLSPSNTVREMDAKLRDYFAAGVRLVWYVDPVARNVRVFTAVDKVVVVGENETLTGDPVLPGFTLPLRELFAQLEP
jgi:Uma2 family endonuclease